MNNVYYSPERFGLKVMWMVEAEPDYDFDMVVVWKRVSDGALFWAHDSGCSCPSPFEDYHGVDMLTPLSDGTFEELRRFVHDQRYQASEVMSFLDKVRRAVRRRS